MVVGIRRSKRASHTALAPIFGAADSGDSQQRQKPRGGGGGDAKSGAAPTQLAKKAEELKEEMDTLVDEIDEVLEENAEEFVKNYVQRGGE